MRLRVPAIAILMVSMLPTAAVHADDASCKPLLDAFAKQLDAAFRESIRSRGLITEKIVLPDATFVKTPNGNWAKNATTAQQRNEQLAAVRAATSNCKLVGQETVDGQTAAVYSGHLRAGEMRYWIGRNGLPLKGQGGTGTTQVDWTFFYDHVDVPSGK